MVESLTILLISDTQRTKPSDEIVWGIEGSGYYSPKSGYRLLLEEDLQASRELHSVAAISLPPMSPPSSWSPPAPGIIKINFDTSFVSDKREAFSRIIARNSLAAVNFAIELGFRSIHVEGDSLTVIKKLSSSSSDKSIIRPIISDIKSKLVFFEKITFSHVGRRGNEATHVLAQVYQHFQLPCYWIEDAPPDVEQVALRDLRQ
ncbi:hypothetical protein V6N12_064401 [Hibiscus sabdariffa]|uniref:RNase H type-1 domain-containing protein n=1 Tax=Hibiscus sabdariffa TaxID=183260 RepID=A0ABR2G6Q8_9ROSI